MARNFGPGSNGISGVMARQQGHVTYLVDFSNGQVWKRYVDHLKELVFDRTLPTPESELDTHVPSTSTCDHPSPEEPNDSPNNNDSSQSIAGEHVDSPSTPDTISPSSTSATGAETETEATAVNSETTPRQYPSQQHQAPS